MSIFESLKFVQIRHRKGFVNNIKKITTQFEDGLQTEMSFMCVY